MKLGIGSYTFPWAAGIPGSPPPRPMSVLDLLLKARNLGVTVVQIGDNMPFTRLTSTELALCEAFARDQGLEVEIGARGLDASNLRSYLALARRWHVNWIRLVLDEAEAEYTWPEALARLRRLLPEFKAAGVKLAIENHDRFTARELAHLVRELGTETVGICLDTANSFGAMEIPEAIISTLAPYALNLHVKDFTIRRVATQMGFEITGCPVGRGRLNVPWLLDEVRRHNPAANAIIELWTPPAETLAATLTREQAWAEESVRFLRAFIPE